MLNYLGLTVGSAVLQCASRAMSLFTTHSKFALDAISSKKKMSLAHKWPCQPSVMPKVSVNLQLKVSVWRPRTSVARRRKMKSFAVQLKKVFF